MRRITVTKKRWLILIAMMCTTAAMQIQWLALSSVSAAANNAYANQLPLFGLFNVGVISVIYIFMLFFLTVPSALLIRKVGFAWPIRVTAILIIVASVLKYFFATNMIVIFYLQILLAACQSFVIGGFTDVAERWFATREKGFVLGLLTLSFYIGIMVPLIVSPLFLTDGVINLKSMYLTYAIVCSILATITLATIRSNPKVSIIDENREVLNLDDSLRAVSSSKSVIILVLIVAVSWGIFQSFLVTSDSLNYYIGNKASTSIIGILLIGAGMIGSSVIGGVSDILRKRKIVFVIANIIDLVGVLLLVFFSNYLPIAYISITLIGVSSLTIYPLGMQYASELIYPAKASFSQGIMLIISYGFAIMFTGVIVVYSDSYYSVLLTALVVVTIVSAFATLFIKESSIVRTEDDLIDEANKIESVRRED